MCGRFTLTADPATLHAEFGIRGVPFDYRARFNIAPTQPVIGLVDGEDGWSAADFFWGAAPGAPGGARHINARAETVARLPSFRSSFRSRRCLVLADGFYEWRTDNGRRIPMYIRRIDARPFAFAGLWNESVQQDGTSQFTCTIITTQPNDLMRPIHDRMPVIPPGARVRPLARSADDPQCTSAAARAGRESGVRSVSRFHPREFAP